MTEYDEVRDLVRLHRELEKAQATGMDAYVALQGEVRAAWDEIAWAMDQARDWEREGNLEQAVWMYEALVAGGFFGSMPYDRLRIVYTRQGKLEDAIRVCEAYLGLPEREHGQNKPHFEHHRDKLRGKVGPVR